MTERSIFFNKDNMAALKSGRMRATTRTERMGEVGDHFLYKNRRFEITNVQQMDFGEAIQTTFMLNGFESPNEMVAMMTRFYPNIRTNTTVYVHEFREVSA